MDGSDNPKVMFKKIAKTISVIFCSLFTISSVVFLISNYTPADMLSKTLELKSYCRSRGHNTDFGIVVNYGRHSFQQRFYVVDLNTGDILMKSLCGHGRGGNSNIFQGEFSNISGSNCTSLGHYKIGKERRMYNYPVNAFELDGLDKTNSNARNRAILIHPSVGPRSLGCITLPFYKYKRLAKMIQRQRTSVIMWAYE